MGQLLLRWENIGKKILDLQLTTVTAVYNASKNANTQKAPLLRSLKKGSKNKEGFVLPPVHWRWPTVKGAAWGSLQEGLEWPYGRATDACEEEYLNKFGGLLFPNETRNGNLKYAAHWKAIKKVKKSLTAQGATWAVFSCASRFS